MSTASITTVDNGNLFGKFDLDENGALDLEEFSQMLREFNLSESVIGELKKIISESKDKMSNQDLDLDFATFLQENIMEHYLELIIFLVIEQFVPQIKEKYGDALGIFMQPMTQLSDLSQTRFVNIAHVADDNVAYVSGEELTAFISQLQLQTLPGKDIADIVQTADDFVNKNNKITYQAFATAYYEKIMTKRFDTILYDMSNHNNNEFEGGNYDRIGFAAFGAFGAFAIVFVLIIVLIVAILNKTRNWSYVNNVNIIDSEDNELIELNVCKI